MHTQLAIPCQDASNTHSYDQLFRIGVVKSVERADGATELPLLFFNEKESRDSDDRFDFVAAVSKQSHLKPARNTHSDNVQTFLQAHIWVEISIFLIILFLT